MGFPNHIFFVKYDIFGANDSKPHCLGFAGAVLVV